jgi:hypothetical protein
MGVSEMGSKLCKERLVFFGRKVQGKDASNMLRCQ